MTQEIGIGHNNPPETTPFDLVRIKITDLYEEAKNWLDGDLIDNQEQADAVQSLMRMIQAAEKEADSARKDEAKPHDDAKAEIQGRYNLLIGKTKSVTGLTVRAVEDCKQALAPWLKKRDDEIRAEAEAIRKAAEEKQRLAVQAMQQRDASSLESIEQAEALAQEAKQLDAVAKRAENTRANAKGSGRAASLRTYYTAEITDHTAFARYIWLNHKAEMIEYLDSLAQQLVLAGIHQIDGVTVHEERRVA